MGKKEMFKTEERKKNPLTVCLIARFRGQWPTGPRCRMPVFETQQKKKKKTIRTHTYYTHTISQFLSPSGDYSYVEKKTLLFFRSKNVCGNWIKYGKNL